MPQPTAGDVHVDRPLTNISIAFIQDNKDFIADKVFPIVPVMKQSDKYFIYSKDNWYRSESRKRAPGTESAGSGFELTTDSYFCDVLALHKDVDDQTRANADAPLNMDRDATLFVTQQNLLKREKDWAADFFTTSKWTGASDFTPATLWDAGSSTPVDDIEVNKEAVKTKTGFMPNTLVMSPDVFKALKSNAEILDRIKYTQRGVVTLDLLATLFDVERVMIARAVENTAKEGATAVMANLYTKDCLLVYSAPNPSLMTPSGGYTFTWNGLFGGKALGARIKRFRMEKLASDRIEGEMAYDQKLVAADCGVFFNNCIS